MHYLCQNHMWHKHFVLLQTITCKRYIVNQFLPSITLLVLVNVLLQLFAPLFASYNSPVALLNFTSTFSITVPHFNILCNFSSASPSICAMPVGLNTGFFNWIPYLNRTHWLSRYSALVASQICCRFPHSTKDCTNLTPQLDQSLKKLHLCF